MSDILNQIVAVKHEEIAAAQKRLPFAAMRADAESRVLTRDFEWALRRKMAAGELPATSRRTDLLIDAAIVPITVIVALVWWLRH